MRFLALFLFSILALGCDPEDLCRLDGSVEACPTPEVSPTETPVGAPPQIVGVDPDPIVTHGTNGLIFCADVDDADQGTRPHDWLLWFETTQPQWQPIYTEVSTEAEGNTQTVCWALRTDAQNSPTTTLYLRVQVTDVNMNVDRRIVEWRILP